MDGRKTLLKIIKTFEDIDIFECKLCEHPCVIFHRTIISEPVRPHFCAFRQNLTADFKPIGKEG